MSISMKRWISFILAACLLLSMAPAALMEDVPAEEVIEAQAAEETEIVSDAVEPEAVPEAGEIELSEGEAIL